MTRRLPTLLLVLAALVAAPVVLAAQRETVARVTANPAQFELTIGDTAASEIVLVGPKGVALDPAKRRDIRARAEDPELVRSEVRDGRLHMTALRRGQTLVKIVAGNVNGWVSVDVAERPSSAGTAATVAAEPAAAPAPHASAPAAPSVGIVDLVRSDSAVTLLPGENYQPRVTALKPDRSAVVVPLRFKSYDRTVVSITDSLTGAALAVAPGKSMIGVDLPGSSLATLIAVEVSGASLKLDVDTLNLTGQGGDTLRVTVPDLAGRAYQGKIEWYSADPSVAEVEPASGLVRARAPGTTEVRAHAAGQELRAVIKVYPKPAFVTPPTLPDSALVVVITRERRAILAANNDSAVGRQDTLFAIPARWTVADTTIASYDPVRGMLLGRKLGSTTLSAQPVLHGIKTEPLVYHWPVNVIAGGVSAGTARRGYRVGDRDTLRAVILDSLGNLTTQPAPLSWVSDHPLVLRQVVPGVFEATTPGRALLSGRAPWDSGTTVTAFVAPNLLFPVSGKGTDGRVYASIFGFDTRNQAPRELAPTRAVDADAVVSPDRTRIAFTRSSPNGGLGLWLMDADGANPVSLGADSIRESSPAWSGDGNRIYYIGTLRGRAPRVYAYDRRNDTRTPVTDSLQPVKEFAVSPDGNYLVYSVVKDDQLDLLSGRLNADGRLEPTGVAPFNTRDDELRPRFSSGSGDLFFIRRQLSGKRVQTLMRSRGGSGPAEPVGQLPADVLDYAVSPDGTQFVVQAAHQNPRTRNLKKALYWLEFPPGAPATETLLYEDLQGDTGAPSFAP